MNKTYRLVWNERLASWVAVAERVRACGKRASAVLALVGSMLGLALGLAGMASAQTAPLPPAPTALPSGGQVVAGQAGIAQSGATMTVTQQSPRAAIDWRSFDVGAKAQVDFVQPSADAVALNRVQGGEASRIFGRINANGQVFLSNPNGVYFAPGASVDVGGLVATTHRISLDDFMAGRARFERQGATGSVVNEGELRAALGGYIALLAPEVRHQGVILARMGTAALAAGEAFELQFDGKHTLAGLRVEPSTIQALVDNRSAVLAPGGLILLSAQAVDRVQGGVIRNSGRLEATGLSQRGGRIVLDASDRIENSGQIVANAIADRSAEGPAGQVSLSAPEVVNSGLVEARGVVAPSQEGGAIAVAAGRFTQAATGALDAGGAAKGGSVRVRASGEVAVSGRVVAAASPAPAPAAAPAAAPGVDTSVVEAPAPVADGGRIEIQAAQIEVTGATLDASGARHGGQILLDASRPAPAAPPAPVPAHDPGQLILNGGTQLSSRGRRGVGGSVTLLGDDIGLGGTTAVDARGEAGGGTVQVGGGWQGTGGLYQATTVGLAEHAHIDVSATGAGKGGTAVLWSAVGRDGSHTQVEGTILAGGAGGGAGGQVETSGHGLGVSASARVQTGAGGLWLLDPTDVTISGGSNQNMLLNAGVIAPHDSNNSGTVNAGTVVAALNSGDVTITTRNASGAGFGDISLNASLTKTSATESTLTLLAERDIRVAGGVSVTSTQGKLNLVLISDFDSAGAGAVFFDGSASAITVDTRGGHVWIGGNSYNGAYGGLGYITREWKGLQVGTGYGGANDGSVYEGVRIAGTTIRTGGGSVYVGGMNARTVNGEIRYGVRIDTGSLIDSGSGDIEIEGRLQGRIASGVQAIYGVELNGSALTSTTGDIHITGAEGATDDSSNLGGAGVRLYNSSVRTTGAGGDIVITGTTGVNNGDAGSLRDGVRLHADGNNKSTVVQTDSGAITITGTSNVTSRAEGSGLRLMTSKPVNDDANHAVVRVHSATGNITLVGDSPNNTETGSAGVRFDGAYFGRFYIGQYGATVHSGNTTIRGRSVVEQNLAQGYLELAGSGALAIEPTGTSFVRGASTAQSLDLNGVWRFGTAHSAIAIGKDQGTAGRNDSLRVSAALTTAGAIRLYASYVELHADLTSTLAGAPILVKSTGDIITTAGRKLQTDGGDISLWADSNGSAAGYILLGNSNTLDTRTQAARGNALTTTASGGGDITLGGGDGATAADGYAISASNSERGGVNFGDQTVGGHANQLSLQSGGGDVVVRAKTSSAIALNWVDGGQINAGSTGTVLLEGVATGGSHGMELGSWRNAAVPQPTIIAGGGDAGTPAIRLVGTSAVSKGIQAGSSSLQATGAGGISLVGRGATGRVGIGVGGMDILTASGAILVDGGVGGISYTGRLGQTGTSGSITLAGDEVAFGSGSSATTTGTLTVQPSSASFASPLTWPIGNFTIDPAVSGLTLGRAGNHAAITLASTTSIAGPIAVYAGDITLNADLASTRAGAAILLKANGNIVAAPGVAVRTNGGDLTAWADSDGGGGGYILLKDSVKLDSRTQAARDASLTSTASGGGHITLGGGNGASAADGYAFSNGTVDRGGVNFGDQVEGSHANQLSILSGGGNVVVRGKSTGTIAVNWVDGGTIDAGSTGTVRITGLNEGGSHGIELGSWRNPAVPQPAIVAGGGDAATPAILLSGTSTGTGRGILAGVASLQATGAGGITLVGRGVSAAGLRLSGSVDILATSGATLLDGGTTGIEHNGRIGQAGTTGTITLVGDSLQVSDGLTVTTTGALTVQPYGASFASALSWPPGTVTISPAIGGLTLGKLGNSADITIASATTVAGPVTIHGRNLAIDAALTASGQTVTLVSSGSVTDGANGRITAGGLRLLGGNVTLDGNNHAVDTLAAAGVGSLRYVDGDALAVGSVGGTQGVSASGAVDIATRSGHLTLAESVATTDTGNAALVLNAGRDAAAGTAAGGDLLVQGGASLGVGAGGRVTLYSGSVAGSAGIAARVGSGSGRFRYGSDESASHYSLALGTGLHLIHREQPVITRVVGDASVVYGDSFTPQIALSGQVNGDSYSQAFATGPTAFGVGGSVSGAGHATAGTHAITASGGSATSQLGYAVAPSIQAGTLTVARRTLNLSLAGQGKVYDGTTTATVAIGNDGLVGDTLGVAYDGQFADANAGSGIAIGITGLSINGADAANYQLSGTTGSSSATISRRSVTVTGFVARDKIYDGSNAAGVADWGSVSTGVGSETVALSGSDARFDSADAGSRSVTATGYVLANGSHGGLAANYQLTGTSATAAATIAKAELTVIANNDAKFVSMADGAGYHGVSYSGFVNGETDAVLGGGATVSRRNAGVHQAGTYAGVLEVDTDGLVSNNYRFVSQTGSYTIVPSDQLLVRVDTATTGYGATAAYVIGSASYYDGSTVHQLSLVGVADGGNRFTLRDGAGGSASFTLVPQAVQLSGAGLLRVGAYQLAGSGVTTTNAQNFNNTLTVIGSHSVTPRALTANASAGVSKVYDGTVAMNDLQIGLDGRYAGDVVTAQGLGAFDSRNAGTNLGYSVSLVELSGADAGNYVLQGGSSFTGQNGTITPRVLHVDYQGVDRAYNGGRVATVTVQDDRVAGDVLTVNRNASFADKNVGQGKLVTIDGVSLSGADAGNYTVGSTGQTQADITRLDSVEWIGGPNGNWFDPANWAGGAVPDLANVAHVVIPTGSVVSFDTAGAVAPAQTGPVQIDGLGSGGGLEQRDGVLEIGGGGLTLDAFHQSGGSLASIGDIELHDFVQSGGTTSTQGDFGVEGNFAQSGSGQVTVGGDAVIRDTDGGATIGNFSAGGDLTLVSTDGAISQQPGSTLSVDGTTSVDAGTHDVTLDGANNDFTGPVNVTGGDVTLVDGHGGLVLGDVTASGDFDASSSDGAIQQQPGTTISVDGTTTVDAGGDDVTLDGANNDFIGPVNVTGGDVTLFDGHGGLTLGDVTASGDFDASSSDGAIQQQPGTTIAVHGTTTVDAGSHDVTLDGANNDFTGPVNVTGGDVTLVDGHGGLTLGDVTASGDFDATSTDGAIQQQPGTTISVDGTTTVDAGRHDVTLDGANNDFTGPVNVTGGDVTLVDGHGGLTLGDVTASGDFDASSSDGAIQQQPGTTISVEGTTTVDAGSHDVTLDGANNDFAGPVNVTGGDVTLVDGHGGLTLGDVTVSGDFDATSSDGAIQQQPGSTISVDGTTTVDAGRHDVSLDGANNDFRGPVNATGDDIRLVDGHGGLVLGDVTAVGGFDAKSTDGPIRQQPGSTITVDGTTTVDAGRHDVSLEGANNDFRGPVNAHGGNITLVDGHGGLTLGNVRATGHLAATSHGGDITQAPGSRLDVNGNARLDAPGATVRMGSGSNRIGGALVVVGAPEALQKGRLPVLPPPAPPVVLPTPDTAPPPLGEAVTPSSQAQGRSGAAAVSQGEGSSSGVTVSVEQLPTDQDAGLIVAMVSIDRVAEGFSFELPAELVRDLPPGATIEVSLEDGRELPEWLVFDGSAYRFVATAVPPEALPLRVRVRIGGRSVVIVIVAEGA